MPTSVPGSLVLAGTAGTTEAWAVDRSELVLTLTLLADKVNSPGVLSATVGNGAPDGRAYFFYDAATTPFLDVPLDSTGSQRSIYLSVTKMLAGTHTVRVSADALPPLPGAAANKDFTVVQSNDTGTIVPVTGTEPPMPVAPNRWVFQAYDFSDVNAVDTWVLTTNPTRMSRAFGSAAITNEPTTVSTGRIVSWEGAPKPPTWTFEGVVLTQSDYREMVRWGQTGQRFYITDHFGHRYLVKAVELDVERVRDVQRPWHHSYRMTVHVLQGTGVWVP